MKKKLIIIIISLLIVLILSLLYLFYNPFLNIKLSGKKVYEIKLGEKFDKQVVSATLFGKNITNKIKVYNNLNVNKVGKYKITYKVNYLYTTKKINVTVIVIDTVKPTISLDGETKVSMCPGKKYEEIGYKASDNYDGDITDKVIKTEFNDYIEYSVSDSSGNKASVKRDIVYEDNEKPQIELYGYWNYILNVGDTFNEPGYNISDNCDQSIQDKVEINNNVDTSKSGTYYITYKVTDESGNLESVTRTVKVTDGSYIADYVNIIEGPTYINGILIVNKQYSIPSTYGSGADPTAYNALFKLQQAAADAGYDMPEVSGFRSYYTQRDLYNYYVSIDGVALADTYSARPGHSEHQTGLAFDVGVIDSNFGNTQRGIWLRDHCHEYGFIIRYLPGKEYITGYSYEPWHIRYVGVEHATKIYERGITLEEYVGLY